MDPSPDPEGEQLGIGSHLTRQATIMSRPLVRDSGASAHSDPHTGKTKAMRLLPRCSGEDIPIAGDMECPLRLHCGKRLLVGWVQETTTLASRLSCGNWLVIGSLVDDQKVFTALSYWVFGLLGS